MYVRVFIMKTFLLSWRFYEFISKVNRLYTLLSFYTDLSLILCMGVFFHVQKFVNIYEKFIQIKYFQYESIL